MNEALFTAREKDEVVDVVQAMRSHSVRRIPVVNDRGVLEGIVSMDDLIVLVAEEMDEIAKLILQEPDRESALRR